MLRIVIVDDDKNVLNGIEKTLHQSDLYCEVVGKALNGEEGFNLILDTKPDLVISDIYMPILDGIEMIQKLRNENFEEEIIILSGYSEFKHARQALKLNIADYISKPASRYTILETINDIFDKICNKRKKEQSIKQIESKIKEYSKYLTEELIEQAIQMKLSTANLTTYQKIIIEDWNNQLTYAVKIHFDIKNKKSLDGPLIHFGVENIIKEILDYQDLFYHYIRFDHLESILLIHSSNWDKDLAENSIQLITSKIKTNLNAFYGIDLSLSNGVFSKSWDETIQNIKDILSFNNNFDPFTIEVVSIKKELGQAIRTKDIYLVKKTVERIFEDLIGKTFFPSIALNIGIELFTVFKYELYDSHIDIFEHAHCSSNLYETFRYVESWNELYSFFNKLIENISTEAIFQNNLRHTKLVQEVIQYVDMHLAEKFTLNEIADELYISRNYLGKLFKDSMNITFKEYVTQTRIERARRELLTGKYMIYEVAEAVGFENAAYFTAVFKKELGYSPSKLIQEAT